MIRVIKIYVPYYFCQYEFMAHIHYILFIIYFEKLIFPRIHGEKRYERLRRETQFKVIHD